MIYFKFALGGEYPSANLIGPQRRGLVLYFLGIKPKQPLDTRKEHSVKVLRSPVVDYRKSIDSVIDCRLAQTSAFGFFRQITECNYDIVYFDFHSHSLPCQFKSKPSHVVMCVAFEVARLFYLKPFVSVLANNRNLPFKRVLMHGFPQNIINLCFLHVAIPIFNFLPCLMKLDLFPIFTGGISL